MTDLTGETLKEISLLDTLADVIDKLNDTIANTNFELTEYTTVINHISVAKDLYKELKEISLYTDVLQVKALEQEVSTFLNELQTNMENGVFDYVNARELVINEKINTDTNTVLTSSKAYTDEIKTFLLGNIENINAILQSDDSTLDELQEVVNFIKINKTTLDTLGIDNIAGLRLALDDLKSYTDLREQAINEKITTDTNIALTSSKEYTDAREIVINEKITTDTNIALTSSKEYTDTREQAINEKITTDTNIALTSSKAYTDEIKTFLLGNIENINAILQSDDSTLDELQEVVNFIKINKSTLDTLGIDNIAGLRLALDDLKSYTDLREQAINEKITTDTNIALTSSKDYTDTREVAINQKIESDINTALTSSKAYTDSREIVVNGKIDNANLNADWNNLINKPNFNEKGFSFFKGFKRDGLLLELGSVTLSVLNGLKINCRYVLITDAIFGVNSLYYVEVRAYNSINCLQTFMQRQDNSIYQRAFVDGVWQSFVKIV